MSRKPTPVPLPTGGCQYQVHKHAAFCFKVTDPGERMCPHHKMLIQAEQERRSRIARERETQKREKAAKALRSAAFAGSAQKGRK